MYVGEIQWEYTVCYLCVHEHVTIGNEQCRGRLNGPYSIPKEKKVCNNLNLVGKGVLHARFKSKSFGLRSLPV